MEPTNHSDNTSPQTTRLIEILQTLEADIKRQNSLKYAFIKGSIYGLGTVIGASVLVALFGGIITTVLHTMHVDPTVTKTLELNEQKNLPR